MEMRGMRENIQMERLVGCGQSQAVVEGEITLPGGLREEARVLHCSGMVVVQSVEAMQERVVVEGKVVFNTLYTQGDPKRIQSLEATADFTHTMELAGVQPRMLCRSDVSLEHVEAMAYSGRLTLKAVVDFRCRVLTNQPVSVLTGLSGVDGLEVKTQQLSVRRTVASGESEALLREEFELPAGLQVTETLSATAQPQLGEITGGMGRIGVSGAVAIEVCHASETAGRPLCVTRHTMSFDHSVEIVGEDGEEPQACVSVKDVAVVSQESGEGGRVLRVEVVLGVKAWMDRQEEVTLLSDAYTVSGENVKLTYQQVNCRTSDAAYASAESGKLMLMLPDGSPAARTVLCGFAMPVLTGREQIGGRLTAEGMLEVTLLYMTDDSDVPVTIFQEEPFRMTFAADSASEDFLTLNVSDIEVSAITSDRVEMKYILHLAGRGMGTSEARLVTDAERVTAEPPLGCMALCFARQGESTWDIARRYRIPRKELAALNPDLGQNDPTAGQGVLIWRRGVEEG